MRSLASRFRPFIGALLVLLPAAVSAATDAPAPAQGRAAATTLALLERQRDLCDTIAGRVQTHWAGLAELSTDDQQRRVRDYVLENQLSDLAGSRSISDLVERFLPTAGQETTDETAASLRRLATIARETCDAVALPTAPQEGFSAKVTELLDRFEFERIELGRLLVATADELAEALEPYLFHIQRAGVEAEGAYLAYLDSIRAKPEEPTMAEKMQLWHATVYTPGVAPAKRALGAYLQARKSQNIAQIGASCRVLVTAAIKLLREDTAFQAPDDRVIPLLRPIYIEMRSLATSCTAGNQRKVDQHFAKMQSNLQNAAKFMARYQIRP